MSTDRIALLAVLLALAAWGDLRPRRPIFAPVQIPARQAQPWMVDALPDVGPKRRAAALEAVRAERFDELPKAARVIAHEVFSAGDR